jgi:chromosome partitioning protein
MAVITIYNHKGGSGKTLITVNLAASLAARKFKVLVIDNDAQGNTTSRLGFDEVADNISAIYQQTSVDIPVQMVPFMKNLWLSPGSRNLDELGHKMYQGSEQDRMSLYPLLKKALLKIKSNYDFVLIDTPPSSCSPLVYNALVASDAVITPIDSDGPSAFEGLRTVVPFVNEINFSGLNPGLEFLGVVQNRFSGDGSSKQVEVEMEAWKELATFKTKIKDYKTYKRAQWENVPVVIYDPDSEASQNFMELSKELIKKLNYGSKK